MPILRQTKNNEKKRSNGGKNANTEVAEDSGISP